MKADFMQWKFLDIKLRQLLQYIEGNLGMEFTITSLYRPGDKGVHGTLPVRGADIRCRVMEVGFVVRDYINEEWYYDPSRPSMKCAVAHGKGANFHIHLQVHPNTVFKALIITDFKV